MPCENRHSSIKTGGDRYVNGPQLPFYGFRGGHDGETEVSTRVDVLTWKTVRWGRTVPYVQVGTDSEYDDTGDNSGSIDLS